MTSCNPRVSHQVSEPVFEPGRERSPGHLIAKLAGILRGGGALAVVGSAVVFMLQGLNGVDDVLRDWIYVILMVVLTLTGVASHRFFKDTIGARLLFALAALLVPVQVTQQSATLGTYLESGLWANAASWLVVTLTSFVAAAIAVYFCFQVVARSYSKALTLVYVALNLLLLAPWRDPLITAMTLGLMVSIYFWLNNLVFRGDRLFQLWEGVLVRLMVAAPLLILVVRFAFSMQELLGWSVLLMALAITMWALNYWLAKPGWYKTIVNFVATIFALTGNLLFVLSIAFDNSNLPDSIVIYGIFAPSIFISILAARMSSESGFYHLIASLGVVTMLALLPFFNWSNALLMLLLSALLVLVASRVKSRLLLLTASLCGVIQLGALMILAIGDIQAVSWFALALLGVILVALASLAERYGVTFFRSSARCYHTVSAWSL